MTSLAVQVQILTSPPAAVTLNLLLILIGEYLLLCLRPYHLILGLSQIQITLKVVLRVDQQAALTALMLILRLHTRGTVVAPTQTRHNQVFRWA